VGTLLLCQGLNQFYFAVRRGRGGEEEREEREERKESFKEE